MTLTEDIWAHANETKLMGARYKEHINSPSGTNYES